jgi:hypothetical protein
MLAAGISEGDLDIPVLFLSTMMTCVWGSVRAPSLSKFSELFRICKYLPDLSGGPGGSEASKSEVFIASIPFDLAWRQQNASCQTSASREGIGAVLTWMSLRNAHILLTSECWFLNVMVSPVFLLTGADPVAWLPCDSGEVAGLGPASAGRNSRAWRADSGGDEGGPAAVL